MPAPWGPPYPPPPTRDGLCTRGEQTKLLPLAGGGEHGATCPNFSAGGGRGGCPPPMDGWTWTDGRCRPRPLVFKRPRSYLRRLCPLCVSGSLCVCPPAPRWGVCVWGSLRPPLHPPPTLLLPGGLSRTPGSPSPTPSPGSPMWRPPPPPHKRGGSVCVCSLLPWRGFICVPALTPPFRPPATPLAVAVGGHVASLFTSRPRPPRDSPPHAMTSVT